jgi:hypothetical protein
MSEPGFEELQRLWQSPPPAIAPAQKIILSQRRRRWLSRLYLGSEVVVTLVGIPLAIWIALQPRNLLMGLGLLAVILFAAGASAWARSVRIARVEDPLLASIDQGVRRARIGVRLAYAGLWGLIGGMVFIGALALLWRSTPDLSVASARRMITALGILSLWLAFWLAATIPYLAHRSRELEQMKRARDALKETGQHPEA